MLRIAALPCGAVLAMALVGCGGQAGEKSATTVKLPACGRAYRVLDRAQRTAVAASCRDRIAGSARGLAARELRTVDPVALREQLDGDYGPIAEQRRPVADVAET